MEERLAELYARWLSDPTLRYRGSGASLDSGFDDDLDSWVKGSDSWKKDLDSWAKGSDSWDEDLDDSLDDDTDDDWDNSWKAGGLPRDLSPYSDIDDPYDRADLEYEDDLDDLDDY
jgi:hypothetical protein